MVLLSVLGGGEVKHKVECAEEEAIGGVPIIFFNVWNLLLQAREPRAKATRCVSVEILVFLRPSRPFAW